MNKLFLFIFLFSTFFSDVLAQKNNWTKSEKNKCIEDRLNQMNSETKETASMGIMIMQEFRKTKEEVVACYCSELEEKFVSYNKGKEFIAKKDRKSDRQSFEMGFLCFNDKSIIGNWSKEMKNICYKIFEAKPDLSKSKIKCFCGSVEMYYDNVFEFGEAAKYNEISNQELINKLNNCQ